MKFIEAYDSKHDFTKTELKDIILYHSYGKEDLKLVSEDYSEVLNRWTRPVTTIFEVNGRYFAFNWEQGLTEYQEDYFPFNPVEVVKKEETRLVTVTRWREKNENNRQN